MVEFNPENKTVESNKLPFFIQWIPIHEEILPPLIFVCPASFAPASPASTSLPVMFTYAHERWLNNSWFLDKPSNMQFIWFIAQLALSSSEDAWADLVHVLRQE